MINILIVFSFRQKEDKGTEGVRPEGRTELIHLVGWSAKAHHVRGAPALHPEMRHASPDRKLAPVSHPVHSGARSVLFI